MKNGFALSARNDWVPYRLLRIDLLALLAAGQIIPGVINGEQGAGLFFGAVELHLLDVARVGIARGASLRLRVLLPQPRGHEVARSLQLMLGAVGRPGTVRADRPEYPASGRHRIQCAHP